MWADEAQLRQALDQLSASYANSQQQLRERESAVRTLTESLAVARTESELFQKMWAAAQVRAQTLGANLTATEDVALQQKLVQTLRTLSVAEAGRQRLMMQLTRLVAAVDSNRDVAAAIAQTRDLLAGQDAGPVTLRDGATLETARVLEVNPKLRLVVLDVGAQQGARIGTPMILIRGDQVLGELRIVEVRQRICGALIEKTETGVKPQAGDAASVAKN